MKSFLQFCSILEWDDARLALDVFYGVSNDEFPISFAVILTVLNHRKRQPMRLGIVIWNAIKNVERESSIVSIVYSKSILDFITVIILA
jgi:hypothetical protein